MAVQAASKVEEDDVIELTEVDVHPTVALVRWDIFQWSKKYKCCVEHFNGKEEFELVVEFAWTSKFLQYINRYQFNNVSQVKNGMAVALRSHCFCEHFGESFFIWVSRVILVFICFWVDDCTSPEMPCTLNHYFHIF